MGLKNRLENAKKTFADARARTIVIVLMVIVAVTFGIAYLKFKRSQLPPAGMGSQVSSAPSSISSIPGITNPTREYAQLQEQQNIAAAEEATKKGTAAIPTLVRTTFVDSGVSSDLTKQGGAASVAGCGVEDLKRARAAGVTASELRCRGCSLAALKAAGYTAGELRAAGFSAKDLKDAGFTAAELKDAGFNAKELAAAGFTAKELLAAGYTPAELKGAGFSAADLKAAGASDEAIQAAFGGAVSGDCSFEKAQAARAKGASAAELRKMGCSAAILRAVGYSAKELKDAGFGAKELKDAGFTAAELKAAGYNAKDLRDAGFSAKELKDAGFSAKELKDAGFSAGELKNAGFSAKELKDAGFSAKELKNAGFTAGELKSAGFSNDELKAAGYTDGDLMRAGIAISKESCSPDQLKEALAKGVSATELQQKGCSVDALKAAGFSVAVAEESKAKVTAPSKDIGDCSTASLTKARNLGMSVAHLREAGCSDDALRAAGFSEEELTAATQQVRPDMKAALEKLGSLQQALGRMNDQQLANLSQQEADDLMRMQQQMMMSQANQLFAAWTPIPSQQYVEAPAPTAETPGALTPEQQAAEKLKNMDIYKAGTIVFAVLDTGINSDENAPIMGTIVQGPMKGGKILGNFQRTGKRVVLQFTVLSLPWLPNSIGLNAVAIDPSTARTALASHVDNHYMLRYGTLFASSFISGLGDAFKSAGTTSVMTPIGTFQSTIPDLSPGQRGIVALGNVGKKLGEATGDYVNTPPTVKVDAGSGIGLLLMGDLAIPKPTTSAAVH